MLFRVLTVTGSFAALAVAVCWWDARTEPLWFVPVLTFASGALGAHFVRDLEDDQKDDDP